MILVGSKHFAPDSLKEVLDFMKAKPCELKLSNAGVGATSHLCAVLFVHTTNTKVTMVPYREPDPRCKTWSRAAST
jgi:tripartite-type tricarboxylate transporter receptor subunit TctC